MNFALTPTTTAQPPLFTNLEQCRSWQQTLPVMNPLQTQVQLLEQLQLLNGFTLAGDVRLAMLEALRESIYFAQGESAKKFSGKPLPLTLAEQAVQQAVHGLWEVVLTGYLRCLESSLAGDGSLKSHAATICQRALAALTDDYTDLMRAGCQPGNDFWRQAHALYTSAEALAVTRAAVPDKLRAAAPMTPAAAYVELMLLAAASLHELPPRQQTWVIRWARLWAGKVEHPCHPPDAGILRIAALCRSRWQHPGGLPAAGRQWCALARNHRIAEKPEAAADTAGEGRSGRYTGPPRAG